MLVYQRVSDMYQKLDQFVGHNSTSCKFGRNMEIIGSDELTPRVKKSHKSQVLDQLFVATLWPKQKQFPEITLPETKVAPENGWLEYDSFLLGPGLFSGAFAVSFRECMWQEMVYNIWSSFRKTNKLFLDSAFCWGVVSTPS